MSDFQVKDIPRASLFLTTLIFLLQGCDHSLHIEGHGDIYSESGGRNCALENQPCENIVSDEYQETYTAVPRDGWTFVRWNGCLDEAQAILPSCSFEFSSDAVRSAWGKSFPLTAVFGDLTPLNDLEFEDDKLDLCVKTGTRKAFIYEVEYLDCSHYGVSSLEGIQQLSSLKHLNLLNNDVGDFTPLYALSHLDRLNVARNSVPILPEKVAQLNLEWLTVDLSQALAPAFQNTIHANTKVNAYINSFDEAIGLDWLADFSMVKGVSVIPCPGDNLDWISGHTELEELSFDCAQRYDMSQLSLLTKLKKLEVLAHRESVKGEDSFNLDFLSGLTMLESLTVDVPRIRSLSPLANLKRLEELTVLSDTSDLSPLSNLYNLRSLQMWGYDAGDVTALSQLTLLENVLLIRLGITDLSPFSGLEKLEKLELIENDISDLTPLEGLHALEYLDISHNEVENISPLNSLPQLKTVFLKGNGLVELTPLPALIQLEVLDLSSNQIIDVAPLSTVLSLKHLNLMGNPIGGLGVGHIDSLSTLENLTYLNLLGWQSISCTELDILVDVLGIAVIENGCSDP